MTSRGCNRTNTIQSTILYGATRRTHNVDRGAEAVGRLFYVRGPKVFNIYFIPDMVLLHKSRNIFHASLPPWITAGVFPGIRS